MIVRTTPSIPVEPDAIRAMERLEVQLRRAADDLGRTLADLRRVRVATAITEPVAPGRCGLWMPVAKERCHRRAAHRNSCRTRGAMEAEALMRRAGRAA